MTHHEELPKSHRALVLETRDEPPRVKLIPTPQPGPGSIVVRVLATMVLSYAREVYNGTRPYPFPTPLVIGSSSVGRIAAIGSDTTKLTPGQLVFIDSTIRSRDDSDSLFLFGLHQGFTDGSKKLMEGEWRDSTYAEFCKVPLENCHPLNEHRLLSLPSEGGLGYQVEDLAALAGLLVPYGGLKDIQIQAGETIVVAPATGNFGGHAVRVALAIGARVIALGRNKDILKRLAVENERVEAVQITGDVEADLKEIQKFGTIDAFFDISPAAATKSTHFKSCILALRHGGRTSLMGGIMDDVGIPHAAVMHRNLTLKGKWMYERADVTDLIKMIEIGVLKLGKANGLTTEKFKLEEWDQAFSSSADNVGTGFNALIVP